MASFAVTLAPVGPARVVVEGEDHTGQVAGLHIDAAVGQPTVLTLYEHASGHIEGDGLVRVQPPPAGDDIEAVVNFLAAVDPDTLHREAMAQPGAASNIGAAHLAQLLRMARGGS